MIEYRLKTKSGTTCNYIHSWKKWNIDQNFIEFEWGGNKKNLLVIQINDIVAIEQV